MDDVLKLISELSNKKISNQNDFDLLEKENNNLFYFFNFMKKKDNYELFKKIILTSSLFFKKYYSIKISGNLKISEDSYIKLQCIFAMKALKKSNFDEISEIKKNITIDNTISSHISLEKKYWIYEKKELYPFCKEYRKEVFKFYSTLVIKEVIKEEIIIDGIKTHKKWTIDYDDFEVNELSKFRISFSPFKVFEIKDRYFLISNFFTLTTEVFKENIYSSERFRLKEKNYIEKLCNTPLYFDDKLFKLVYNEYFDKLKDIENNIKKHITCMKTKREEIKILNELNKEQYYSKSIEIIKFNLVWLNEISFHSHFKIYLSNWIKSKFNSVRYNKKHINELWKEISSLNPILDGSKEINKNEIDEMLENNKIKIIEVLNNEYNEEIDEEKIKEKDLKNFISLNFKKIISDYKSLGLLKEAGDEYGKEVEEIRNLDFLRIEQQRVLSDLYNINNLRLINNIKDEIINKEIYFPLFYDFRGRMYVHSSIGITNFKLSRYFFHYGWYDEKEISLLNEVKINEINKFIKEIEEIMVKNNIKREDNSIKESIFWCVLALGKEFIDKTKIFNKLEDIFKVGKEKILSDNKELDVEKRIIISYYKEMVLSLKNKKIIKRFIHKDATASFIQNTIRILGPKNLAAMEYANLLSNDKWYDTYSMSLEFWKKTLIINNNLIILEDKKISIKLLEYFNRKTIKKPVMTDSYQATYLSQWYYFVSEVKKEFKIELKWKSEEEILFKNFIKFLSNSFWDEYFLAVNSKAMTDHIEQLLKSNKPAIISSIDAESNIAYYKLKSKTLDVIIRIPESSKKYRKTKSILVIDTDSINFRKIKNATKPNWVHFSDAYLTRQINILMKSYLFTIHDCFLVDILNVSNFIIKANEAYKILDDFSIAKNKELIKLTNSIFIFF